MSFVLGLMDYWFDSQLPLLIAFCPSRPLLLFLCACAFSSFLSSIYDRN